MSLLQEALRRKEQDESQGKEDSIASASPAHSGAGLQQKSPADVSFPPVSAPPGGQDIPPQSMPVPARPATGTPQPQAGTAQALRRTTNVLWWVVGTAVAAFIGLTVVGGGILLFRLLPAFKTGIVKQIDHNIKTTAVATGNIDILTDRVTPTPPPAADATDDAKDLSTVIPEQPAGITQNAEVTPVPQQTAPKPPPLKPKRATPKSSPEKWPVLRLAGILRGRGTSDSSALINGTMIAVGQTIEGVTVTEIHAGHIVLRYNSETKTLRVGAVLY